MCYCHFECKWWGTNPAKEGSGNSRAGDSHDRYIRASYLSQTLGIESNPRNLYNFFKDRDIPQQSAWVQISGRLWFFSWKCLTLVLRNQRWKHRAWRLHAVVQSPGHAAPGTSAYPLVISLVDSHLILGFIILGIADSAEYTEKLKKAFELKFAATGRIGLLRSAEIHWKRSKHAFSLQRTGGLLFYSGAIERPNKTGTPNSVYRVVLSLLSLL